MKSYRIIAIALLMIAFIAGSCKKAAGPDKPNIVFLFADDWGKYASVYDSIDGGGTINSVFTTPNIDQIARSGVIFTNAHVPAPSCTPCRSSILSGQYFYRTGMGAILHGAVWDDKIPTYPPILQANGYHTGYSYKVWAPGTVPAEPYGGGKEDKLTGDGLARRLESMKDNRWYFQNPEDELAYELGGTNFNRFSQYVTAKGDIEQGKEDLLTEVRKNFESFLDADEEGKPFCYWFGPTNTHRAWVRGSGKNLWGLNPDDLKGKMPSYVPDVPEIREDFADYLGEALAWDASVGVIYNVLKERGELDNTVIVISGDHGIPGFPRAKTNLYNLGTHVALIVSCPKRYKGNRVVDDFVNLMDLAPTFLEMGNAEIPDIMDGKSILPILQSDKSGLVDKSRTWILSGRERHVAQAREGNLPYPQRAIRTKDYLFIRNFKPDRWPIGTVEKGMRDIDGGPTKAWFMRNKDNPEYSWEWNLAFGKRPYEELYDLSKDPYQVNNVVGEAEYVRVRNKMAAMLDSIMVATKDPRCYNEDCVFDRMPYTTPR